MRSRSSSRVVSSIRGSSLPCWQSIWKTRDRSFRAISHLLADDGIVFFSTAIESAQRDHVYEFNNESDPLKMAEDAGLRVTRLVSDASAPPVGARYLPRATAMILRRR